MTQPEEEQCGRCSHPVDLHTKNTGPFPRACLKEMPRGIHCACKEPRRTT